MLGYNLLLLYCYYYQTIVGPTAPSRDGSAWCCMDPCPEVCQPADFIATGCIRQWKLHHCSPKGSSLFYWCYSFPSPLIFLTLWFLCPVRLNDKRLITTHTGGGTQKPPCPGCSPGCLQMSLRLRGPWPGVRDSSWDAGIGILGSRKTLTRGSEEEPKVRTGRDWGSLWRIDYWKTEG